MALDKRMKTIPACALATVLTFGQVPAMAFAAQGGADDESTASSVVATETNDVEIIAAVTSSATAETDDSSATIAADSSASFTFSDDGISVAEGSASGYKIDGTTLTINAAGTYVVSGSCSDGSIKVKKGTTGVTLVLDGLDLASSTTAPLACNKSSEVSVVASAGTINTLTDAALNNDDTYPDNTDAENAVIKCKDGSQVKLAGEGTLNIVANGKNGIKSGATTDEEGEASLTISDLELNITASVNDAINAEQTLNIESGTVTVSAADDGIHSDYVLNVGAEGTDGPTINVKESYEGLEAATLNIFSGDISILSSDDCMNAANSNLADYAFEMNIAGGSIYAYSTEGDGFDSNGTLTFTGGATEVWTANAADNQPLDSDGVLTIDGGTVFAAGGSSGNGETVSGTQTFVMFGGSNAGGQPGQPGGDGQAGQGGQPGSSAGISAGSTVSVVDASGNVLRTATAPCSASYVFYSSSALTSGDSYTLTSAGEEIATGTAGENTGGNSGGQPGQPGQPGGGEGSSQPSKPGDGSNPSQPGQPGGGNPQNPGQAGAQQFTDVNADAWYAQAVRFCAQKRLMTGYSNTTLFGPEDTLTRAQLVTILWRAACPDEAAAYDGSAKNATAWADAASNEFYTAAANWAYENKVVNGYDNEDGSTSFAPDDVVTFEQLVKIMASYAAMADSDAVKAADQANLENFTDGNAVSTWARQSMAWATQVGLVGGYDNHDGTHTLKSDEGVIRGRAAMVIMNAYGIGVLS